MGVKSLKFSVFIFTLLVLASFAIATNILNDPTTCSGEWSNCSNANGDGSGEATASKDDVGTWQDYGFSISSSEDIDEVLVRADFFGSKTNMHIDVEVSNDGGSTFASAHRIGGVTSETTFIINVTNDFSWTPAGLNNTNLRVRATCVKQGAGSPGTCSLDYIPVNVSHSGATCTRSNPTVTITPSTQSGSAGDTLAYNVNITNEDTSACGSSLFNMSSDIPSGWTGSFKDNTLTINAGTLGTTTFNLTSSGSEDPGDFKFNNTATNTNSSDSTTTTATYEVTGDFANPQTVSADSTTCSGSWTSCSNAHANGGGVATAPRNTEGLWNGYGFSIASGSSIDEVLVRADFFASRTNGYLDVRVSNDGGSTWASAHRVGGITSETTFIINVTDDFSWTPAGLNNANFRVNATCVKQGGGPNPTCSLDYIPVNVTYREQDTSPVSNGSANPTSGLEPLNVSFTGDFSSGNGPFMFFWDFDDSTNSTDQNPSHVFNAGTYNVSFTVTDDDGDSDTEFILITVDADLQPTANASATPTSGLEPLNVSFTGDFSGGNSPFTFFWNFDDGTNSTSQNLSHVFTNDGTYNVSFTVTDGQNDQDTNFILITVDADTAPVANASANPTSGTAPLNVSFFGNFNGGNGPFIFFWDFDDGTNSTLQFPDHIFTSAGTYNVSFAVTDDQNDQDTDFVLISVS